MIEVASFSISLILVGASAFQVMLAAGKPWGEWAFGGQIKGRLPVKFRVASAISVFVYGLQIWHYIGLVHGIPAFGSPATEDTINWVLVAFFAAGAIMNGISRSKKERSLWTPVLLVSLILSLVVALG